MATYTIELRKICELYGREEVESWFSSYNLADFLTPVQIDLIDKYKVWSKEKLSKKIVDHYYFREIAYETPAQFSFMAKATMNEIMERYLLKIYSKFLEYDPLSNVDYTETYTREITGEAENQGNSKSNSASNSSGLNIRNGTPQQRITKQDLNSGAYASEVNQSDTDSKINDETTTDSKGKSKTLEKYVHEMKGDNGVIVTNQYLVREFRELASSFDEEIIRELNKLFMGLY